MLQQDTDRLHDVARRVRKVRGRLITYSVPLAKRAAAKYRGESTTLAYVDLEQEANLAIISVTYRWGNAGRNLKA
jgi:hypothetical protein